MPGFTFNSGGTQQTTGSFGTAAGGFGAAQPKAGFGAQPTFGAQPSSGAQPLFGNQAGFGGQGVFGGQPAAQPATQQSQPGSFGQQLREAPEDIQRQVCEANGQLADNTQRIQSVQGVLCQIPL